MNKIYLIVEYGTIAEEDTKIHGFFTNFEDAISFRDKINANIKYGDGVGVMETKQIDKNTNLNLSYSVMN